jgi:hypothetical protein
MCSSNARRFGRELALGFKFRGRGRLRSGLITHDAPAELGLGPVAGLPSRVADQQLMFVEPGDCNGDGRRVTVAAHHDWGDERPASSRGHGKIPVNGLP